MKGDWAFRKPLMRLLAVKLERLKSVRKVLRLILFSGASIFHMMANDLHG